MNCINLANGDIIVKMLTGVVTCIAFIAALLQYLRSRKDIRAKQFLELRNYFRNNASFQTIIQQLYTETGKQNFDPILMNERIEFMAFFEDIAFLMNSKLLNEEVAYYMFGGDAITAWNNDWFWDPKLRTDERMGIVKYFRKADDEDR